MPGLIFFIAFRNSQLMNKIRRLKRLFGRKGVSRRRSLRFGRSLPIRFAEYAELLEDRTLLAASLLDAPLEGVINPGSENELQLTLPAAPGGTGAVSLGFLMSADHSSLNPAAIRFKNAAGTVIAPSFSNPNRKITPRRKIKYNPHIKINRAPIDYLFF